ncbi:NADPH:quinone oxidoreductase family protein [Thauera sp. 2A1]|uniref:NADPH:quinone oxidoreductase family protein n=1 Tax=Thauera sp. 2A1 TaxID=2570191 RepID=UPI001291287F|nr:NADPH:quinone oxidoreductase family protein [Thauera sp. 2A1]KAI5912197.1 NADPH:quinone oxidoreductase family protein [Thauera sp. 2A1]KAI5915021.1 NADPH:quinone oxidoreductase family protein [Thauera sp. 2A1]
MSATPPPSPTYALVCRAYGNPPQIAVEPWARPNTPAAGEVVIDVNCAALNFTDHLMMQGRYQDRPSLPFVPGLDAAGTVHAVGAGVTHLKPGDVVVSSGVVGAYASQLVAPARRVILLPPGLSPQDAVASINSHLTAYHGLVDRAALKAGERVLVLGASGAVGRAAMQLAAHLGAQLYSVERAAEGRLSLRDHTHDRTVTVESAALRQGLKELLGPRGADIVVDPVGDLYTEPAVRALAWRGRLLVIGFAAGAIPSVPMNLLLLKGASLVGVYCGGLLANEEAQFTTQLARVFDLLAEGVLTPNAWEATPARAFADAWQRFSAPRGAKVLLDFGR